MRKIDITDLLTAPWTFDDDGEGYNCRTLVIEILRRLGAEVPAFPSKGHEHPIEAVEKYSTAWVLLGSSPFAAKKLGDIIVTDPTREGRAVHLSIVVGERPRRVLTAVQRIGVTRAPQIGEDETVGCYRLKELA